MDMTESTMLDGCKSGMDLGDVSAGGLATEIAKKDYDYLAEKLRQNYEVLYTEESVTANVKLDHTFARLKLNQYKGKYYFNVDGNPVSFLTGQNVLGSTNVSRSIQEYYKGIERAIQRKDEEFRMPESVRKSVVEMNIFLHSVSFACYTSDLDLKSLAQFKKMLDCIEHVYSFSVPDYEKSTLKEQLGIRIIRDGDYSIRFEKKMSDNSNGKYWTLVLYNKAAEMKAKKKEAPDWTRDRIRFDLTLHNRWLHGNRLNTLSKLHDKYGHDFKSWIHKVLASVLNTIQLQYILTFTPVHKLDVGKYKKEFELWEEGKLRRNNVREDCLDWFADQGVNVMLPYELHGIATLGRATYGLDKKLVREVLRSGGRGLLGKRIEDNVDEYPALMNNAHLLLPNMSFRPSARR